MIRSSLLLLGVLVASVACVQKGDGTPVQNTPIAPPMTTATPHGPSGPTLAEQLASGTLPEGPEAAIVHARCVICHGEDYIVQQRLTPEQWKKTLAKMQKFGAPITDDESAKVGPWLSALYVPELPDRPLKIVGKADEAIPEWRQHAK